jgi:hypothetical protein
MAPTDPPQRRRGVTAPSAAPRGERIMTHDTTIKTPESHPDHPVVGKVWRGWDGIEYFCDSYDPRIGFWMTDVNDPANRKNVSERAIHRTFHPVEPKRTEGGS